MRRSSSGFVDILFAEEVVGIDAQRQGIFLEEAFADPYSIIIPTVRLALQTDPTCALTSPYVEFEIPGAGVVPVDVIIGCPSVVFESERVRADLSVLHVSACRNRHLRVDVPVEISVERCASVQAEVAVGGVFHILIEVDVVFDGVVGLLQCHSDITSQFGAKVGVGERDAVESLALQIRISHLHFSRIVGLLEGIELPERGSRDAHLIGEAQVVGGGEHVGHRGVWHHIVEMLAEIHAAAVGKSIPM